MRKDRKMSRKLKNKLGFSLIELIVVISIMVVLSGMLVPMFVKYLQEKRATACRADREAILSVYAKCVYGNSLQVSDDDIEALIGADASAGVVPEDFANEVKDHKMCPMDGIYTGDIIIDAEGKTIARVKCSEHGTDEVVMDFTGWSGLGQEAMADPEYVVPTPSIPPIATSAPEPTDVPTPTPATGKNGVWPYQFDDNGLLDERWANAGGEGGKKGCIPGNYVDIPLPERAHFIADRSGAEYVIVHGYPDANANYYRVKAEWADGPDTIDASGWEIIVKVSRKFDTVTNPPPFTLIKDWGNKKVYQLTYGDMVTMHFGDKAVTYIYNKLNYSIVDPNNPDEIKDMQLPTEQNPVYGRSYDGWYYVPPLYTGK